MAQPQVVVGIDESTAARQAMLWAVAECARRGAALLLAHAGSAVRRGQLPAAVSRSLALARAEATGYAGAGGIRISAVITTESPADLLIRLSERADLVVVGSCGDGGQPALLGSAAFRVSAEARCPVTVVPGGWNERASHRGPVVVGIPASVAVRSPMYVAFEQARARAVPVCAVRTWSGTAWSGKLAELIYAGSSGFQASQRDYVELMLEPVRTLYPDVPVRTVLAAERAEDVLLRATTRASLLVLGSRFVDGQSRSRLDTTSARLMQLAPCPVLVTGRTGWRADSEQPAVPAADSLRPARVGLSGVHR
jgi:nucleotide-binding universal stress UspA family protein